jgi:hypothetical protein
VSKLSVYVWAGVPKPTVTTNSSVSKDDPELSGIVTAGASAGAATGGKKTEFLEGEVTELDRRHE